MHQLANESAIGCRLTVPEYTLFLLSFQLARVEGQQGQQQEKQLTQIFLFYIIKVYN